MKLDITFGSFLLALVGATSGWAAWWIGQRQQLIQKAVIAAEKSVNEKRDFDHLLRNQSEISKNIAHGFDDIERQISDQNNELREIKAYLIRNRNNTYDKES
ncbi:hypothetical protein [Nostoc sp.]|uniref:hypothetical protein n=1 Tax=Nostoc sp. TaxID=1180 RepID=UPI002FFCA255